MKKIIYSTLIFILGFSVQAFAAESKVDPVADKHLKNMSEYLSKLKAFKIQTENIIEVVDSAGHKIQYNYHINATIKRPDKLHAVRKGEVYDQEFYYDGKKLTLYSKGLNYYASAETPPNIDEMLIFAIENLNIHASGGDFIYSDSYTALMEDVVSGYYIGTNYIDGVKCHHLAYRGNEVDWQIWIEDGKKPLPKRYVITSKWITSAPQFTISVKNWNLSPRINNNMFTFTPPEGSTKIDFVRYK